MKAGRRRIFAVAIPSAALLLALAAVLAYAAIAVFPMKCFDEGQKRFFAAFPEVPGDELGVRMGREPFDADISAELSDLPGFAAGLERLAGGVELNAGVKRGRSEGGARFSSSVGGMELLKYVGLITKDRVMAGTVISFLGIGSMRAASMELPGKPDDPLEMKLASLAAGADAGALERVWAKLKDSFYRSLEPNTFRMSCGSLSDAMNGKKSNTITAVFSLDSDSAARLIDSMYGKLRDDDEFFRDLDTALRSDGGDDARARVKKAVADAMTYLEREELDFRMQVHFMGFTPAAVELTAALTGERGFDCKALLQKNTRGGTAGYIIKADYMPAEGDRVFIDANATIAKTADGYRYRGMADSVSGGERVQHTLDGTSVIEKESSEKYTVNTVLQYGWQSEGSGGSIETGLEEKIAFGRLVIPLEEDEDYLYGELSGNARDVETLDDLYGAVFK